jgi:hypothetical protein
MVESVESLESVESSHASVRPSPRALARLAGFLYLVPLAPFGILYVPSLVVPGDAEATANRILASESLVRLSIASALLSQVGLYSSLWPCTGFSSRSAAGRPC